MFASAVPLKKRVWSLVSWSVELVPLSSLMPVTTGTAGAV